MFVIVFKLPQEPASERKVRGHEKYSINISRTLRRVMRRNKVPHYAHTHTHISGSDMTFNDSAVHTTCQNCILRIDSISYFY